MEEQIQTLKVSFDEIKSLEFESSESLKLYLQTWALKNGFEVTKSTGTKAYAVYFKCSRSGKPRKFAKAEGKRSKPSKKIGNNSKFFLSHCLGCPFTFAFLFDVGKKKFLFNQDFGTAEHNHCEEKKTKIKLHEKEISDFVKKEVIEKGDKPALLQEKLNLKFRDIQIIY